jgi:hypothetical protein
MMPENKGAPEANAMPRQSGKATKNTTRPAGKSSFKYLNVSSGALFFIIFFIE